MTKADLKFVSSKPRTQARQALAEAVAALRDAESNVATLRTSVSRAKELCDQAEARLALANADVDKAREATTSKMLAAVESGAPLSTDRSTSSARARQLDAADDVEAAKAALATIESRMAEVEARIRSPYGLGARRTAEDAAARVLSEEAVTVLLQEFQAMQVKMIAKASALLRLRSLLLNNNGGDTIMPLIELRFLERASSNNESAAIWADVRDRLLEDPDAALPI